MGGKKEHITLLAAENKRIETQSDSIRVEHNGNSMEFLDVWHSSGTLCHTRTHTYSISCEYYTLQSYPYHFANINSSDAADCISSIFAWFCKSIWTPKLATYCPPVYGQLQVTWLYSAVCQTKKSQQFYASITLLQLLVIHGPPRDMLNLLILFDVVAQRGHRRIRLKVVNSCMLNGMKSSLIWTFAIMCVIMNEKPEAMLWKHSITKATLQIQNIAHFWMLLTGQSLCSVNHSQWLKHFNCGSQHWCYWYVDIDFIPCLFPLQTRDF